MNISRREQVMSWRKAGLTYAEIGRRLSVSRERVRQIAKGNHAPQRADLESKTVLTTTDVAQLLGVHANTVRRLSAKGILKSYRVSFQGHRRFKRDDIDEFLSEGKIVEERVFNNKGTGRSSASLFPRHPLPISEGDQGTRLPNNILRTRAFELWDEKYQGARKMTRLAQVMGISLAHVYRVRIGERKINGSFVVGAAKAFPECKLDELFYVGEEAISHENISEVRCKRG